MIKKRLSNFKITIIILAILLMIGSVIVSSGLVEKNDEEIMQLQTKAKQKQDAIDHIWQSAVNQEEKMNNVIILSLLAKNQQEDYSALLEYYTGAENNSPENLVKILEQTKQNRLEAINTINDLYHEKANLENTTSRKAQESKQYGIIAIFLQLLGVVLITIATGDLKRD